MGDNRAMQTIGWEEAAEIFNGFCVFVDNPEMRWFKKVWEGFIEEGKASYRNDVEMHWVLARIVRLGLVFNEFVELAWDEPCDVAGLLPVALSYEKRLNFVTLVSMVDSRWAPPDPDPSDRFWYIGELAHECRRDVYDTLVKIFGDPTRLFLSLWFSTDQAVEVGEYSEKQYDAVINQDTSLAKEMALGFVLMGLDDIAN